MVQQDGCNPIYHNRLALALHSSLLLQQGALQGKTVAWRSLLASACQAALPFFLIVSILYLQYTLSKATSSSIIYLPSCQPCSPNLLNVLQVQELLVAFLKSCLPDPPC